MTSETIDRLTRTFEILAEAHGQPCPRIERPEQSPNRASQFVINKTALCAIVPWSKLQHQSKKWPELVPLDTVQEFFKTENDTSTKARIGEALLVREAFGDLSCNEDDFPHPDHLRFENRVVFYICKRVISDPLFEPFWSKTFPEFQREVITGDNKWFDIMWTKIKLCCEVQENTSSHDSSNDVLKRDIARMRGFDIVSFQQVKFHKDPAMYLYEFWYKTVRPRLIACMLAHHEPFLQRYIEYMFGIYVKQRIERAESRLKTETRSAVLENLDNYVNVLKRVFDNGTDSIQFIRAFFEAKVLEIQKREPIMTVDKFAQIIGDSALIDELADYARSMPDHNYIDNPDPKKVKLLSSVMIRCVHSVIISPVLKETTLEYLLFVEESFADINNTLRHHYENLIKKSAEAHINVTNYKIEKEVRQMKKNIATKQRMVESGEAKYKELRRYIIQVEREIRKIPISDSNASALIQLTKLFNQRIIKPHDSSLIQMQIGESLYPGFPFLYSGELTDAVCIHKFREICKIHGFHSKTINEVIKKICTDFNLQTTTLRRITLIDKDIPAADETMDTAIDDAAIDDAAIDDSAIDDTAIDDAAIDDASIDDSAIDDAAIDDSAIDDAASNDAASNDTAIDDTAENLGDLINDIF